ncbi:SpaH/EbpB family LPXTG-anchored major pilin [Streptococcus sp. FT1-106]|uniref:SpaH/EbpB family LPXTG-anchored major pilin n=1 Tax=Streptococcus sp. FT1-106 TaxID=3409994 RepID=UPI003BF570FB
MKNMTKFLTTLFATLALLFVGGQVNAQSVDTGAGGTASITIDNAAQGQTYTIYKLFDATVDGNGAISYKVPTGKNFTGNDFFSVDKSGNVLAKDNIDVSSDAFKTWAAGFGTEVKSAKAEDNTLVFSNLTYGYYYVKSSLGTTITVDSTNPNATIKDKNTTNPDIPNDGAKKIVVNGATTSETTAKIGDVIDYKIAFNATNYVTTSGTDSKLITKYTIVDTPSDLKINQSTVKVTVDGKEVTVTPTYGTDGKMTIELAWVKADGKTTIYNSPAEVVVTYKATVKAGAQDGTASNSAKISYTTADGETPIPDPNPDPDPKVYTYQFTLNKTSKEDGSDTLTGAEFKLYDAASGGNEIKVVKNTDGTYRVAEAGENGQVIEAGKVVIKGLKGDNTKYYLEEIKAPNGYNILTERKEVSISSTATNTSNVVNKKGAELPSTGSFGTTMFYIAGSVLLLAAFVYMISKRRMKNIH